MTVETVMIYGMCILSIIIFIQVYEINRTFNKMNKSLKEMLYKFRKEVNPEVDKQ